MPKKQKISGDVKIKGDLEVTDKLYVHKFDTNNLKINLDNNFSQVFNQSTNVGNLIQINFSIALLNDLIIGGEDDIIIPNNGLYKIANIDDEHKWPKNTIYGHITYLTTEYELLMSEESDEESPDLNQNNSRKLLPCLIDTNGNIYISVIQKSFCLTNYNGDYWEGGSFSSVTSFYQGDVLSMTLVYIINREKLVDNGQPLVALNKNSKQILAIKKAKLASKEQAKTNSLNTMFKKIEDDPELLAKFRNLMNVQPSN